jgi:2-polyprenyl-3-methyl-5-hydroxy-6-metoxy-1,4-benzoquinol methylase
MTEKVKSPVTLTENTELVEKLSLSTIVDNYKTKIKVDVSRLFKMTDETLSVYKCNDTGYRFFYPLQVAGDAQFYDEILGNQGSAYYSTWKTEYEVARQEILKLGKTDAKVLDIGCGFGNFLLGLKNDNILGKGLEFNNTAIQHCIKEGFEVTMESIEEHALNHENKYDVICAFQVLEHVANINSFLKACVSCLKPNGKLVLGVPNNEPYYSGFHNYAILNVPPHHMGLWSLGAFEKIQPYFNIKLLFHQYDSQISFLKYLLWKSKYLIQKSTNKPETNTLIYVLSAFFSIFLLPVEIFNLKNLYKKVLYERIIVIYEKNK